MLQQYLRNKFPVWNIILVITVHFSNTWNVAFYFSFFEHAI